MAGGPVFQTTVRLELPVQVRRSIVKDDSLVEVVSQLLCVGKKGGGCKREDGLSQPSEQSERFDFLRMWRWVSLIKNDITVETLHQG